MHLRLRRRRSNGGADTESTRVDSEWRRQWFDKFVAVTELPLLVLTVLMVPVLIIPFVWHHGAARYGGLLDAIDYFIWTVFLMAYLVKLALAPSRAQFVRRNIPDLIVVVVPFLRPLRIINSVRALRLARLSRLGAFADRGVRKAKKSAHARAGRYVVVLARTVLLLTSVVVLSLEERAPGASIRNFGDALWWGITTMTTVGYGDKVPVTPGGKAVAAMLMITGVAIYGLLAASMAAFFIKDADKPAERLSSDKLSEILARLTAIEVALATSPSRMENRPGLDAVRRGMGAGEDLDPRP